MVSPDADEDESDSGSNSGNEEADKAEKDEKMDKNKNTEELFKANRLVKQCDKINGGQMHHFAKYLPPEESEYPQSNSSFTAFVEVWKVTEKDLFEP